MSINEVYFYIPNLIGYARIISGAAAFWVATECPWTFLILYGLSQLLDAFDGHAARHFNQSTRYGAVLDMVTDRASTACLWILLAQLWPQQALVFQFLLGLDIMSHYSRLTATHIGGSKSHKDVDATTNIFLRYYYGSRVVLFTLCMGQEATFALLYAYAMILKQSVSERFIPAEYVYFAYLFFLPLGALKQFMNLVQFWQSMVDIAEIDLADRSSSAGSKKSASPKVSKKEAPATHETVPAPAPKSPGAKRTKSPSKGRKSD